MKILQLTNKVPVPPRDGGSIASFRLSEGLIHAGHEVDLLAMNTSKHFIDKDLWEPICEQAGIQLYPVFIDTSIRPVKALQNFLFSRLPYTAQRFYCEDYRVQLIELLERSVYDIIIIENLYPIIYLPTIKKLSTAKIIFRAHNVEHEIWDRTAKQSKGLKRFYLNKLTKRIKRLEVSSLNKYDFLAPITDRDGQRLTEMGNHKPCKTLPTGILVKNISPIKISESRMEVAHLGALDWSPNQEGLLWFIKEVWPLILQSKPDARFHVAGRNAPEWLIKKLKLASVVYHGEVNSASDFISHFPIHIVPLWSGSGMRIKIVESMALGRAIVTTPIGVEGIPARDGIEVEIASEASDFASRTLKLYTNPKSLQEMSQNAYTFVRNEFENNKLVKEFIDFVEKNDATS